MTAADLVAPVSLVPLATMAITAGLKVTMEEVLASFSARCAAARRCWRTHHGGLPGRSIHPVGNDGRPRRRDSPAEGTTNCQLL